MLQHIATEVCYLECRGLVLLYQRYVGIIAPRVRKSEPPRPLRRSKRLEKIQKLAVANLEKKQECLYKP